MTEDHRLKPPPGASGSREAAAGESLNQPCNGFHQTLQKLKKNVTTKISARPHECGGEQNMAHIMQKHFKCAHHQTPAVQNDTHQGASSNQNIERSTKDELCLHPSDDNKPQNPSGCANQGVPEEPASKVQASSSGVEDIPDFKSVDAKLQDTCEFMENMRLLGGPGKSMVPATKDGPKDLDAADDFQTTYPYRPPLKNFDTAIENIVNVWAILLGRKQVLHME
ncbi:hypothetical protein BDR03DRAFT_1005106 [Suillus americanus]|nr:hypothetical protein BDR03DRAFT_1005106 [Suillus americanus]